MLIALNRYSLPSTAIRWLNGTIPSAVVISPSKVRNCRRTGRAGSYQASARPVSLRADSPSPVTVMRSSKRTQLTGPVLTGVRGMNRLVTGSL